MDGQEVLREPLPNLRALWEATSFQLERLQANEICVKQEEEGLAKRTQPYFKLTFDPSEMPNISQLSKAKQNLYHILCIPRFKLMIVFVIKLFLDSLLLLIIQPQNVVTSTR